ncbi:MAG: iron ABC transporter [Flavobacteriales bacterium CG18_big_fil_WC_8_21_14_2_50_32_9]|nr:iron ABC transporter permease [Flavobacteriales bacterium]PIQ15212.1 MAG: iron ABC transporter [Flavobacteriales bacterium CG18_big_fil_WC_8_21_14_2_50_32_9]PJC62655.1 MAG: iron ABC transporter [Flavobacteriales bacterium CG_4_9_14_0_2_um_filter_32_27]
MPLKLNKISLLLVLLSISAVFFFIEDLFLGSVHIPFSNVIDILFTSSSEKLSWNIIVLESRLPRALTAILCGAALSISGLQMQTLFRNPLAGPYILGISSGAGLGVAIFIMGLGFLGISLTHLTWIGNYGIIISSIIGSSCVLFILLVSIIRLKDIMTVLILGIMIGSVASALISIIQYFSYDNSLKSFVMWMMGDLSNVSLAQLKILFPVVLLGLILSFLISKKLNTYLLGEDYAQSLGVNIKMTQFTIIIITAILAGSITAYCGPIGFVGIVVPHLARLISKSSNHIIIIPLSVLIGTNMLLISDIISQLPGSEKVIPINAITSLIGIPFIFWIIFKNKRISELN